MLKTQEKYMDYLDTLQLQLKEGGISEEQVATLQISSLKDAIAETEMLVPVVGAFSSGKSSLLNSFLGKEYLPVGITPETSLATELRYVADEQNQRIEAVKDENLFERYEIDQIKEVSRNASSYKYMRLYLHNNRLKEIEPLILVDMPGFQSPLDIHNKAIMEYLNRGVHYVVLISVEDGTITRSMERKLQDIISFKRDISFFLSKANLRSFEEVENIRERLVEHIEDILDVTKNVIPIDDNGGDSLNKILKTIDPELICTSIFKDDVKEKFYSAIDLINTIIAGLKHDKDENEVAIENLSRSLDAIIQQRDRLISEAKDKYSDVSVNYIAEQVGQDLTSSIDELVSAAINGGSSSLQAVLSDIVRSSLLNHIQTFLHDTGQDLVDNFVYELKNVNMKDVSDLSLSEESINKMAEYIKSLLSEVSDIFSRKTEDEDKNARAKNTYRVITTILSVTTNIVSPIIEIIIILLPDILGAFFKNWQRNSQENIIRSQILTSIIPDIKRKIRIELPKVLHQEIEKMIIGISNEFEEKIEKKKSTLEAVQNEYKVKIEDIQQAITQYNNLLENVKKLLKEII
ncbi:dynamin family protein [Desulfonauticus submarinus]